LAAVKLLSNELVVPSHEGIRRGERGHRLEVFAVEREGQGRETTAFGIGEAEASITEFSVKSAVFFQEISDDLLLVALDPTGDHGDENLQNHSSSWG
jgi:hypothetical protein